MLWIPSRTSFVLRHGFALFIFVGGFSMLTTYWFAWQLRLYHALEILAGEMVYAFVLRMLFFPQADPSALASEIPGSGEFPEGGSSTVRKWVKRSGRRYFQVGR